jgi:nicotinamide riboside kinase
MKIALLGAESTGKTQLAHAVAAHLRSNGYSAIAVDEYLRQWCEETGRTPGQSEQARIAQTQRERIEVAATKASCVIADTTPLMTAIYSEFIFQDTRLTADALAYQRGFDLTLLTGLDIPWQADGIQRDGAQVRVPVDTLLRCKLQHAGIAFDVIYGTGDQRTNRALEAIARSFKPPIATNPIAPCAGITKENHANDLKRWQGRCEKCSDPDCEHQLFRSLLDQSKY